MLTYLPLHFLAYFNVKNINFKGYLKEIMSGYGILQHYDDASIFISRNSRFTEDNYNRETINSDSFVSNLSEILSPDELWDDGINITSYKDDYTSLAFIDKASILGKNWIQEGSAKLSSQTLDKAI